ncbi:uncharacterized protein LOC116772669 isoform X2 [Danaus plexippus]|uniref:uncharacterized protein LOC116772669 isoform X2 n=1 Tax=Danaus plexippus TaxID=13037 RepID=UPI002AB0D951|nr:uncharacterized protein LOC116772669 isoform X2 [Danaus plexippus]
MICSLLLLLIVNISSSLGNLVQFSNSTEHILCRHCGKEVSTSDSIIFKPSDEFLYAFNDTLYNRNDVFVQILLKDILFKFPIVTSSNSTCISEGEWEDNLWFPEYLWKPCFCECGTLVGFVFESIGKLNGDPEVFYGLILTQLIGEQYSILTFPSSNL